MYISVRTSKVVLNVFNTCLIVLVLPVHSSKQQQQQNSSRHTETHIDCLVMLCRVCLDKLLQRHLHMSALCLQIHIVFKYANALVRREHVCACASLCECVMWRAL